MLNFQRPAFLDLTNFCWLEVITDYGIRVRHLRKPRNRDERSPVSSPRCPDKIYKGGLFAVARVSSKISA